MSAIQTASLPIVPPLKQIVNCFVAAGLLAGSMDRQFASLHFGKEIGMLTLKLVELPLGPIRYAVGLGS